MNEHPEHTPDADSSETGGIHRRQLLVAGAAGAVTVGAAATGLPTVLGVGTAPAYAASSSSQAPTTEAPTTTEPPTTTTEPSTTTTEPPTPTTTQPAPTTHSLTMSLYLMPQPSVYYTSGGPAAWRMWDAPSGGNVIATQTVNIKAFDTGAPNADHPEDGISLYWRFPATSLSQVWVDHPESVVGPYLSGWPGYGLMSMVPSNTVVGDNRLQIDMPSASIEYGGMIYVYVQG